ncbi:MAG: phage gp6-like head-tail connector protein [Firmicutes bacterium]|nr:phage gp6-like head-tail connector protein [Bacillota bacterium]
MLAKVKGYLRITWRDEDSAIADLIDRGKAKLNELAGADLDFDTEGLARSLLFDCVRYLYNNAGEYFEENFQKEILRLQIMTGVAQQQVSGEDNGDEAES